MNKIKVAITGTRGIPAKYGGFETFAQELSVLLVNYDFEVTVYCDYQQPDHQLEDFKGVKLVYSKTTKTRNPLLYYYSTLKASLKQNDIILVTGTGGAFFYYLNLFKKKVIITNTDGIESRRNKWSWSKKTFIKITEYLAIRFTDHLIADSKGISQYIINKYGKKINKKLSTIEYGAHINDYRNDGVLKKYNVSASSYYLIVARLEPENNIAEIISGYIKSKSKKPLIVVGNKTGSDYIEKLLTNANDQIRFVGGIYNQLELSALRTDAFAYLHGHSVGGTNPSLLEALGSGNICICHDNIFNREVTDNLMFYFKNEKILSQKIQHIEQLDKKEQIGYQQKARERIENYYNWENICKKYIKVLRKNDR